MIPLREYAENINRTWEGILDEPEKHPRFVVRPPNGLLLIWFKNDNEKYPDLKLDLSKCDCAPESLEFWRRKVRSGEIWQQAFSGIVKREGFNTQNSSWLLPLGLWDEVPKDINEVRVGLKLPKETLGIRFTIRHIWVETENIITQPISEDAQMKIRTENPLGELVQFFKAMVDEGWIQVGAEKLVQERFTNSMLKEQVSSDIPFFDWLSPSPKLKALALKFGWQTKQLPDHFLLKGRPLKLSTIQSGGHESDYTHREAVEELKKKYKL